MPNDSKSPAMQAALNALTRNMFGRERSASIRGNECVICGAKVAAFRNPLSEKEFSISGMCQDCQDSVFGA